jgi:hypothetical protein
VPVPIQVQLFDAFVGSQEGIHSVILPDIFSSGGSKNVFIDKFGRVVKISGYTKQNAAALTTNTGASAAMVRGVIPYRGTEGGSVTRKLILVLDDQVNEWEIWVSTDSGVTASFLYDAGSGSVGMVPDAAQFGDDIYITNGKVQPRIYDGTSIATTGLTQSPTPTAAASASSGNLKGNYRYKLISLIDGVRQNGSASSAVINPVIDKQVDVSWTADANTDVDGYEVYRTTGTGTTFYYLTTIGARLTVTYTDNTSDLTLLENRILEEHGDAPPVAYFCEPHKQRMWWLRTDTHPTRGYWSDPGEPQSVYDQNYLNFSDSETVGDQITGGLGNYEGLFVVFTEKTLWTVSGTGAIIGDITDWTKTRTNAGTGSVSHRSAVRIPAGSKFTDQLGQAQTTSVSSIAYFTPLGDIRLFDGDNDLIISHPVRDTVKAFNYAHRQKTWAVIDSDNEQAIWFFPSGSSTEPNVAVCWNFRYGVWYKWETMPFGHGVELDTSSDAALMLVGESLTSKGAYVYKFLNGTSFDGSDIDARWMTKTLYGVNEQAQPALSNTKRWRWLDLLFRVDADLDVTVSWFPGSATDTASALGSVIVSPDTQSLYTAQGSEIITANGSSITIAILSAQGKSLLTTSDGDYLHDEGIRLRVGSNDDNGAWALEAMQLAYQILPGLRRRSQGAT